MIHHEQPLEPPPAPGEGTAFAADRRGLDLRAMEALRETERVCLETGLALTPLRRQVLESIWRGHRPMKAYELVEQLKGLRGRVSAMTVYRILEVLMAHGLVHRLASLNAYTGCSHPGRDHDFAFLICRECHAVVEVEDSHIAGAVADAAASSGFMVQTPMVEVWGLCPACLRARRNDGDDH